MKKRTSGRMSKRLWEQKNQFHQQPQPNHHTRSSECLESDTKTSTGTQCSERGGDMAAEPIKASRQSELPRKKQSKTKQIRNALASVMVPALIRALGFTMLRVNHLYGSLAGRFLWWTNSEAKRISETNLKIAFPELPEDEHNRLLKKSLRELGKTITELGPVWSWGEQSVRGLVRAVNGQHHVEQAQQTGRGVIMLAPHLGSWELMGLYLSIEYGITSLYRPPRLGAIDNFTRHARQRFGADLVPTNMSGVRALRRALADNKMIGILPDQDPGESGGIQAPFFGYSARTMLLVSKLAAKTKAPVIFAFAERLNKGQGYQVRYVPARSAIASTDENEAAAALNADVETIIRINPAQYQWSYKRYKYTADINANPYDSNRRAA